MNNREIVAKLHEYYDARDKHKALRAELTKIAFGCGCPQQDAIKAAPEYLDGYLAGCGVMPATRAAE